MLLGCYFLGSQLFKISVQQYHLLDTIEAFEKERGLSLREEKKGFRQSQNSVDLALSTSSSSAAPF